MAKTILSGVETIEYAPASALGVVTDANWKKIEHITMGSVSHVEGTQTKNDVFEEDSDVAAFSTYSPAEGDQLIFSVLDQNPTLLQELYNVKWTAATSEMAFKARKKIANLAFRLTSRPVEGRKLVYTYFNTEVQTTSDGAITKDNAQSKVLTATLKGYRPAGETEDFIYSKKIVAADGTVINSTAA
jgi:hypothetical protein